MRSPSLILSPPRRRGFPSSLRSIGAIGLVAGLVLGLAGCARRRDDIPLGEVSGLVSLDGQPLPRAGVTFVPGERGHESHGFTDDAGRYRLQYETKRPGAVVGRHRVEIRTGGEGYDNNGNFVETKERLPAKYHAKSELTATVVPGSNQIDFQLASRPSAKPR